MPQEMEQLCQEAEEAPLRALILCRSSGQSKDVSCLSHAASISRLYKVWIPPVLQHHSTCWRGEWCFLPFCNGSESLISIKCLPWKTALTCYAVGAGLLLNGHRILESTQCALITGWWAPNDATINSLNGARRKASPKRHFPTGKSALFCWKSNGILIKPSLTEQPDGVTSCESRCCTRAVPVGCHCTYKYPCVHPLHVTNTANSILVAANAQPRRCCSLSLLSPPHLALFFWILSPPKRCSPSGPQFCLAPFSAITPCKATKPAPVFVIALWQVTGTCPP